MTQADKAVLKRLRMIPGVGASISRDLWNLGFRSVEELRGQDPQALYDRLCELQGMRIDRCMLYVMRCAVYYASHEDHDPALLRWWSWKDRTDPLSPEHGAPAPFPAGHPALA